MIKVDNVTKIYDNGSVAVKDLSLQINKGEFVFIVGSSGSGKSTLIKMLLKEVEPTAGRIYIDKDDITVMKRKNIPFLRRKVSVVFQDFRLLNSRTVYENVAFAMEIVGTPQRIIRREVPKILSLVGLHTKAKVYPNELSGGEQQRVAIARAVINRPPVLLADEPTGNLDPKTAWEIMNLLQDINERGTTVIVATHARDIVDSMHKRVIALQDGVLLKDDREGGYSYEL